MESNINPKNNAEVSKQPQMSFRPQMLIAERFNMTNIENYVFDILMAFINDEPDESADNIEYMVCLQPIADIMDDKGAYHAYSMLRDGFKALYDHDIILGDDAKGMHLRILGSYSWSRKDLTVTVRMNPDIKKLLIEAKKTQANTFFLYRYTLRLRNKYALKLYYMLKSWANTTGKGYFPIDELKYRLDAPEKGKTAEFMRVIDSAVKEINDKSDIHVEYEAEKSVVSGKKKISKLAFVIEDKKIKDKRHTSKNADVRDLMTSMTDALKAEGLFLEEESVAKAAEVASKSGLDSETVRKRVKYVADRKDKTKNMTGYLIFAMGKNFIEPQEDIQSKSKEKPDNRKKNAFHNFNERDYDFEMLEEKLLSKPQKLNRHNS